MSSIVAEYAKMESFDKQQSVWVSKEKSKCEGIKQNKFGGYKYEHAKCKLATVCNEERG